MNSYRKYVLSRLINLIIWLNREEVSKEELSKIYKEIERAHKIRGEMHSLWTTELYRLSIANMVNQNSHLK